MFPFRQSSSFARWSSDAAVHDVAGLQVREPGCVPASPLCAHLPRRRPRCRRPLEVLLAVPLVRSLGPGLAGGDLAPPRPGAVLLAGSTMPAQFTRALPAKQVACMPAQKPASASAVMAIYLTAVSPWNPVLLVISAAVLYAIVYLLIESWMVGGFRNLRARYL